MKKKLLVVAMAATMAVAGAMTAFADAPDDYIAHFTFDETLEDETGTYTAYGVSTGWGSGLDNSTDKADSDWTYEDSNVGKAIRINSDGDNVGLCLGVNLADTSYTISFIAQADSAVATTPICWIGRLDQSTESWNGFWNGFNGPAWTADSVGVSSNDSSGARVGITPTTLLNAATDSTFSWTVITWSVDIENDYTATLYYDGVEVGSVSGIAALEDDALVYFGANYWDNPSNYLVDEVYIYDRVLTADEVAAVAEAGVMTEEQLEEASISASIAESEAAVSESISESERVSELASVQASRNAATADSSDETSADTSSDSDSNTTTIVVVVVVVVIVVVVIIAVVLGSKKKKK